MATKKGKSWGIIKPLVIAVLLAAVIRYFLFAHIVVNGHSMMPTLENKEHLIINKVSYNLGKPHRFDIVVFHATKDTDYIKRVIGLPGETIEYKNDILYVNGDAVKEPYLKKYKAKTPGLLTYNFKTKVPKGTVFVMGDNRRNSRDSRYIGPISIDRVIGKGEFVFWPFSDFKIIQ